MQPIHRELCSSQPPTTFPVDGCHYHTINTTLEIDGYLKVLLEQLEACHFSEHDLFGIRLALEEAIVNAIKHGHQYDARKTVHIRHHITDDRLLVEIEDEGPGFDMGDVPDPLIAENLEREGGRGLLLIRCYMTWVEFNETGNRLTMCKQRSGH